MSARAKHLEGKSLENSRNKVLGVMSVEDIKNFLADCANLAEPVVYPEHRPHFERWLRRWRGLFSFRREQEIDVSTASLEDVLNGKAEVEEQVELEQFEGAPEQSEPEQFAEPKVLTIPVPRDQLEIFAPIARTTLRRLWTEQDSRQRDWYFYRLRDAHRQMIRHLEGGYENADWGGEKTVQNLMSYALQEVPIISPFEAAMYWLQLNHTLMLYCGNPLCPAPYFLREEKAKKQKYCSPECANPARRAAKLRWWNKARKSPKS
jgi:hypothetical protein